MKDKFFTTKNMTVAAAMTAISFVLYMFVKFPLPFMFPSFLDVQFSELPAILTGFMLGPVWGSIVIVIKCLLKMPFTSTACVGEVGDLLMGVAFVLPSALWYKKHRTKKGALIALVLGTASEVIVAVLVNGVLLIPFYAKAFGWDAVVGMLTSLFPKVSRRNIYLYYLPLSVLPFNLMRLSIVSVITFFVYKHLHKLINRMFAPREKANAKQPQTISAQADGTAATVSAPASISANGESAPPKPPAEKADRAESGAR